MGTRAGVISQVVRPPAVGAELVDEEPEPLLGLETELLGAVSPKRAREFAAGRTCARAALRALGEGRVGPAVDGGPIAILRGPKGEPKWPDGVVGSITHSAGYAAAAVAAATELHAIGIDAEPDAPLPPRVRLRVATNAERHWLEAHEGNWDRVLFSAKESVYKAWFAYTGRSLGFHDATITFAPDRGTLRVDIAEARLDGAFAVVDKIIVTAVVVPR